MARITLDPLTRIEGHLRLNATVFDGMVTHATSTARLWPGFAMLLKGRDPLDAWSYAQRFCGVCTTVHAVTSIRSIEQALGLAIPLNALYYRNCLMAQHSLHEHILHFYGRSLLDWVDISSACRANPVSSASLAQNASSLPGHSAQDLQAVQDKLKRFSADGTQASLFTADYCGHPAMRLSPESNLLLAAHYLNAFEYQRKTAHVLDMLQGKSPLSGTLQHLSVGGIAPDALAPDRLAVIRILIEDIRRFVQDVFLPDMIAIASGYPEWFSYGAGITNYLAVPEFPEDALNTSFAIDGGTIFNGDFSTFRRIANHSDKRLLKNFDVPENHFGYDAGTALSNTLAEPATQTQRFDGVSLQTGPLAQILSAYCSGNHRVKPLVDQVCTTIGIVVTDLHSTMGRNLARAIRAHVLSDLSLENLDMLMANCAGGDTSCAASFEIPAGEFHGAGFHEASRGTLFHGIVIKDRKIEDYTVTAPSSWNSASRDVTGVTGPYEASLFEHPVAVAEKPLELLRTMRSFDPCIACAVHVSDQTGNEIARANVL
jgi:hydrogenase large subunit